VKKPLLAMASVSTWEASSDRTSHIKAHLFISKEKKSLEDSLGHWRKRENRGKYRENLKSKEHKD